jgi:protease IV
MEILQLPKPTSILDKLMDGDLKSPFGAAKALEDLLQVPDAARAIRDIAPLLRQKDPIKAMMPYRIEVK